jgi:hypothetical protein
MTIDSFAAGVLRTLKLPTTRENMRAMRAWANQEGGHYHNSARYNIYNTTQPAAGSQTFRSVGQGAADIRIYRNEQQGIQATAQTLANGHYGNILSALRRGNNAAAVIKAVELSPWGTHHISLNGASSAPAPQGSARAPQPTDPASYGTTGGAMTYTANETPASNVPDRRESFLAALQQRSSSRGLPKMGHGSLLKTADYLFRTGQATSHIPTQYSSMTKITPARVTAAPEPGKPSASPRSTGHGNFTISGPNPGRLKPELVSFARRVADIAGEHIVGSDGSTHPKFTVNGRISEHWSGNATDIPAVGTRLVHLGQAALMAAGMPRAQALKQHGGLFNIGNHQIIFNVNGLQYGGDHTDHLHISTHAR